MKIALSGFLLLSLALLTQVAGHEEAKQTTPSAIDESATKEIGEPVKFNMWMDVKLEQSQLILAGLAEGDFTAIEKSARELRSLNKIEGFVRRGFPGYRTQLRSFEFAVAEIEKQSSNQNIEGVALGFQQLTLSCVNCHKQLRQPAADLKEVLDE